VTTCRSVTVEAAYRYSEWRWIPSECTDPRLQALGPGGYETELMLLSTDPSTFRPIQLRHIKGDASRSRLTSSWRGLTCRNEIEPNSRYCVMEAGTAVWVRK
jgi:hypothetical protein